MTNAHPGKVLQQEFMEPRNLSQNALARALDVPPRRINEIILGKRKITADTDLRLCRFFGLEPGTFLKMQITSDLDERSKILNAALSGMPAASNQIAKPGFYARLAQRRNDDFALRQCVEEVVSKIENNPTSEQRPGMLLGRIQSGKTRAFLGVIARSFDQSYDVAVILTKGTKTLAAQTVARLGADFSQEIDNDEILVFDIMTPPGRLIRGDLKKKLIIVAKKQVDNLSRLNKFFTQDYPSLANAKVLLIDDEADLASIRFIKRTGLNNIEQGKIAEKMDEFRAAVASTSFLQVTATPYSLYLQPDGYMDQNNDPIFKPMKPAFTVLLPMHGGYVGGETYFGPRTAGSPEDYLFVPVSMNEQDTLRTADKRKIKPEKVLTSPNTAGLARGIVAFVLAACIRQWQQREAGEKRSKYAMVIHNDTQKAAHEWQEQVVEWIFEAIIGNGASSSELMTIFTIAYEDLRKSVLANSGTLPDFESAYEMFMEAFEGDEVARERVNSDKDVLALLDDNAELRLRTSFNIFIGGSILDRGITIPNLIAFYYGRNPQTTQADTVLQHSRMYGNRARADVAVTRLYTSTAVYDRMYTINSFETALREAFEKKVTQDQGVVFIQTDSTGRVRPCAPNKLLLSEVIAIRSGGYYLPTRIQTTTAKVVKDADKDIMRLIGKEPSKGIAAEISIETAEKIITALEPTLVTSDTSFDWGAMKALLKFYAEKSQHKIDLYVERNRALDAEASGDKTGESIVGMRMRGILRNPARKNPALILLEQEGSKELHWSGYKFWWPVIVAPEGVEPCVFASKVQN